MTTALSQQFCDPFVDDLMRIADPPLDHIVEEDEEVSVEILPTLQGIVNGNPVIFKNGKLMPSTATARKGRGRSSGPVDLDESVIDDGDETEDSEEEASSSDDNQDNDTTLQPHPVDLDSLQDREENFSMIFREHEDEFLVWKGNEKLQKVALTNAHLSQQQQHGAKKYGQSCRSGVKSCSQSLPIQNNKFMEPVFDKEHTIVFYEDDAVEEIKYNEPVYADDRSLDTYGFSVTAPSVDSYGFSIKGSNTRPACTVGDTATSADADVPFFKTAITSGESRARTIQRIKEVLKKDQDPASEGDSSTLEGLGAKARGLRSLRLRSDNYRKMNTVHEDQELQSPEGAILSPWRLLRKHHESPPEEYKDQGSAVEYPGNYGLVVQIANNRADHAAQSVVSDITALSDKIFLRVKTEPESKWDDVSSVGLAGVEGRPETPEPTSRENEMMYTQEMVGQNVRNPPFAFNCDDKTPPFPFAPNGIEPNNQESKWDDISSIGLVGVEAKRKGQKTLHTPKPLEVRIPSIISSSNSHPSGDSGNARSRKSQDVFRQQNDSGKFLDKPKQSSQIEISRTFSTVRTGDSYASEVSGGFVDPEMQMVQEVSSCTSEISENSKETSIQSCKLTPREWLIVAAVFLLVVTAVAVTVIYVYANL